VPLPGDGESALALRLRAIDGGDHELGVWVFSVGEREASPPPSRAAMIRSREEGGSLFLETGHLLVELDLQRGQLVQLSREGRRFPLHGGFSASEESLAVLDVDRIDSEERQGVRFRYHGGDLRTTTFSVDSTGWLCVEWEIEVVVESALVGLSFAYPEDDVLGARWLGEGPFRVWGNRRGGGVLGLWEKSWNDTATAVQWTYPEFKGFHTGVRWLSLRTRRGDLGLRLEDGLYLGLFRPAFAEGMAVDGESLARNTDAELPRGDLSFLHSISSIGTKFHTAEELGPQGRERLPPGLYRGRVWIGIDEGP